MMSEGTKRGQERSLKSLPSCTSSSPRRVWFWDDMGRLLFTQPLIERIALKLSKHFPIQLEWGSSLRLNQKTLLILCCVTAKLIMYLLSVTCFFVYSVVLFINVTCYRCLLHYQGFFAETSGRFLEKNILRNTLILLFSSFIPLILIQGHWHGWTVSYSCC